MLIKNSGETKLKLMISKLCIQMNIHYFLFCFLFLIYILFYIFYIFSLRIADHFGINDNNLGHDFVVLSLLKLL